MKRDLFLSGKVPVHVATSHRPSSLNIKIAIIAVTYANENKFIEDIDMMI
jgi:hypothetical protein